MIDPFAAAPEEAQQQPVDTESKSVAEAPAKKAVGTVHVDVKPNLVGFGGLGDSEQVRITMKSGSAYDVPWVTVDFPSIDVAHERLTDVARQVKLAEVFGIAAKANAKFIELVAEAKPAHTASVVSAPAAPSPSSPPRGAVSAPGGESRSCKHGEMQFRSGVGASNGKPWKAFMCPTPKGTPDQCDAEWLR